MPQNRAAIRFISVHHITAHQELKMGSEVEKKEPRDPKHLLMALLVALIVVSAGAVVYVLYTNSKAVDSSASRAIIAGDTVSLNYIGKFLDGRVFDTSLWYVAQDDAFYPKSLTFSARSNDSYKPLEMTAGNYGPGGTIKGFALGVIGMRVGEQRTLVISPEDAYPVSPEAIETINVTDRLPITEVWTEQQFKDAFNTDPIPFATVSHYFWKWPVLVANISGGYVTTQSQPPVGISVYPFGDPNTAEKPTGWEVKVRTYDPTANGGIGEIVIEHIVSAEDVYNVKGTDQDGTSFVLSSFDGANGTFQIHKSDLAHGYNGEISGRTLVFDVTIVKVTAG